MIDPTPGTEGTITAWPTLTTTQGERQLVCWEDFFDELSEDPGPFLGDEHPGWSAASFRDDRRKLANVERVWAVVLDYDGTVTLDDAAKSLSRYWGLLHATKRHTDETHRFRAVLPLSRPVSVFEHSAIWRRLDARWPGKLDPQAKDASRFWYLPGVADGCAFEARRLGGDLMDPDAILSEAEPGQPVQLRRREHESDVERRASDYLAKMQPAISGAGGHIATWAAALAMAQGFGLSESVVFRLLWTEFNPRCQPPWSEREIRHKAADACNKAKVPHGYKLDSLRSRHHPWPPPIDSCSATPDELPPEAHCDDSEPMREPGEDLEEADEAQQVWQRLGVRRVSDVLQQVYDEAKVGEKPPSVSTGNHTLDELFGGFRRDNITVLGAITSWGKSSFGVMVMDEGIAAGKKILVVTGEDNENKYGQRLAARRAQINAFRLRQNELDDDELGRLLNVAHRAEDSPFFLDGVGKNAESLSSGITMLCAEIDYDLVIVDYLQAILCARRCQDRRNEVTYVARCFADAIRKAGTAGLLISQFKRLEKSKRPTIFDLKESGDLENMADAILLGWSDETTDQLGSQAKEKHYVTLAKNKDGPKGREPIFLPFNREQASFVTVRCPQ